LPTASRHFRFVVPILNDDEGVIIAGHGRYAAAKLLDLKQVPAIKVHGLSEAKRRALALADNKIGENAGWDRERLAIELPALADIPTSMSGCGAGSIGKNAVLAASGETFETIEEQRAATPAAA